MTTNFDPLNIPLEGTSLIEANAGAGKTWAITDLYLRLILEKNLSPRNILVVSFTVASTDELRDRIRRRLRKALRCFEGFAVDDPFLAELAKACEERGRKEEGRQSILAAISSFDEAAIYTIHGFCLRILTDYAFECGSAFEVEMVDDQDGLLDEIIADHYRRNYCLAGREVVNYVHDKGFSRKDLKDLLKRALPNPYLKVIPPERGVTGDDVNRENDRYLGLIGLFREEWQQRREPLSTKLASLSLNKTTYGGEKTDRIIGIIDQFMNSPGPCLPLPKEFVKITASELCRKTNKGKETPRDDLFDRADEIFFAATSLEETIQGWLHDQTLGLVKRAKQEVASRREEKRDLSFDDLLVRVHQVLAGENAGAIAKAIRQRFMAAMIDEFQDTDETQYSIFMRLFSDAGIATFYIGDPKQAIYSFRGADIFSYLKAAKHTSARFTKKLNWRSDGRLIAAVNRIFTGCENPFVYKEITFEPSEAADIQRGTGLQLNGLSRAPLQLWRLGEEQDESGEGKGASRTIKLGWGRQKVVRAVAGEIRRLLCLAAEGKALIDETRLQERDIAILVRKNREARLMRAGLSELGIKSIVFGMGSVYATDEAQELERLLWALAQPGNENLVRNALATRIFGIGALELERIGQENPLRGEWLSRFRAWGEIARRHGFIIMFRRLMREEGVRERFLKYENGERGLTNILHLMELLHQAETKRHLSLSGLAFFLAGKRKEPSEKEKELQLRLESDESAVRIVTIHKSKGLEYPIVFCPFSWSGTETHHAGFLHFHDQNDHFRPTCDLGSEDLSVHRDWSQKEALAEECRLLYVALTRAKYRCYFVWGRFRGAETSAAAHLLHHGRLPDDQDLLADLRRIATTEEDIISISPLPEPDNREATPVQEQEATLPLACRQFRGVIDNSWQVTSASRIMTGSLNIRRAELPDYDEASYHPGEAESAVGWRIAGEDASAAQDPTGGIPRGARAGTMLHEILRAVDFTEIATAPTRSIVEEKLLLHGYDPDLTDEIMALLKRVTALPLDGKEMRLCAIGRSARIDEMSFYYPLDSLDKEALWKIFTTHQASHPLYLRMLEQLHLPGATGFMRGFIDLVFLYQGRYYLVDWKSNYLGGGIADYGKEKLSREMTESLYILQYLVYVLALHQYLGSRIPDYRYGEHFGGVYYLFLRGMERAHGPDYGVYYDLPPAELVERLKDLLISP
ncbi:MAG: exodeoxyribonuclease V subunit beta [Smithellaceae bacterium]|nr:exodeoxyribonuclease V subunit beta [Smithellaceae bacterium]